MVGWQHQLNGQSLSKFQEIVKVKEAWSAAVHGVAKSQTWLTELNWQKIIVVFVQSLSHVWLFAPPWTAASQAPLSSTVSQSLLKFMSIESVMLFNHPILCFPLLLLPTDFPSIKVSSNELALPIKGPKVLGVSPSASVFPVTIQGWFPSGVTDLIFLHFKELSGVFESISSSVLSFLCGPTLTSVHDYWKP